MYWLSLYVYQFLYINLSVSWKAWTYEKARVAYVASGQSGFSENMTDWRQNLPLKARKKQAATNSSS